MPKTTPLRTARLGMLMTPEAAERLVELCREHRISQSKFIEAIVLFSTPEQIAESLLLHTEKYRKPEKPRKTELLKELRGLPPEELRRLVELVKEERDGV